MGTITFRRGVLPKGGEVIVLVDEVEITTSIQANLMIESVRDAAMALAYGDLLKESDYVLINSAGYSVLVEIGGKHGNNHS